MRSIIRYTIIAVWTGAVFIAGIGAKPLLARALRGDPADHPSHVMRLEQFRHLNSSAADVVVLGDSFAEQGEWSEWLGSGVVNRGIGQNTTSDILARLDAVPASRSAILMIGSNDLERGDTPAIVAQRTALIISRLNRSVYLVSVLPRSGRNASATRALNAMNRDHCKAANCQYVDTFADIAPNGELPSTLTRDGIHLNGEGYAKLAATIKSALRTLPPPRG